MSTNNTSRRSSCGWTCTWWARLPHCLVHAQWLVVGVAVDVVLAVAVAVSVAVAIAVVVVVVVVAVVVAVAAVAVVLLLLLPLLLLLSNGRADSVCPCCAVLSHRHRDRAIDQDEQRRHNEAVSKNLTGTAPRRTHDVTKACAHRSRHFTAVHLTVRLLLCCVVPSFLPLVRAFQYHRYRYRYRYRYRSPRCTCRQHHHSRQQECREGSSSCGGRADGGGADGRRGRRHPIRTAPADFRSAPAPSPHSKRALTAPARGTTRTDRRPHRRPHRPRHRPPSPLRRRRACTGRSHPRGRPRPRPRPRVTARPRPQPQRRAAVGSRRVCRSFQTRRGSCRCRCRCRFRYRYRAVCAYAFPSVIACSGWLACTCV